MKQLEKNDLIIGEIYFKNNFIFKHVNTDPYLCDNYAVHGLNNTYYHGNGHIKIYNESPQRLATPEEKHWLEVCIAANSFISYEEAMKTFKKDEFVLPKDTVLQLNQIRGKGTTIVQVQCSEGGIYQLGDKITVFTKDSSNKGRVLTIKGFRWNNAKTNLCAITELHTPNGIGLDKIELYSEPIVKKLSLLEQAKLKYSIGTKVTNRKAACFNKNDDLYPGDFIIDNKNFEEDENFITIDLISNEKRTIYNKKHNIWAEIVEDFKLPEKWCVKRTIDNFKIINNWCNNNHIDDEHNSYVDSYGYIHSERCNNSFNSFKRSKGGTQDLSFTEITFEQFEQYVLHNGFKVGDIVNNGNWIIYDLQYIDGHSIAFYKYAGSGNTNIQCRILTKNIVK